MSDAKRYDKWRDALDVVLKFMDPQSETGRSLRELRGFVVACEHDPAATWIGRKRTAADGAVAEDPPSQ